MCLTSGQSLTSHPSPPNSEHSEGPRVRTGPSAGHGAGPMSPSCNALRRFRRLLWGAVPSHILTPPQCDDILVLKPRARAHCSKALAHSAEATAINSGDLKSPQIRSRDPLLPSDRAEAKAQIRGIWRRSQGRGGT